MTTAPGSPGEVVPSSVTPLPDGLVPSTPVPDVPALDSSVPGKAAEPVSAADLTPVAVNTGAESGTVSIDPALPVGDVSMSPASSSPVDEAKSGSADASNLAPTAEVPVASPAPTIENVLSVPNVESASPAVVASENLEVTTLNVTEPIITVVAGPPEPEAPVRIAVAKPVEAPVLPAPASVIAVPPPSLPQAVQPATAGAAPASLSTASAPAQSGKKGKGKGKQTVGKNQRAEGAVAFQPPPIMMYAPPAPSSPLGGPVTWLGVTVLAVLLAGLVLNRDAFTPFGVEVAPVAVNTLTATTLTAQAGKVASTGMTIGDLVPGATVIRQTIQVVAEAGSKAMVPYVSALANLPADGTADAARVDAVRIIQFRCTDPQGAPMACDKATRFIEARVDPAGANSVVIETSGGLPTAATVRPGANGDLDILDGAGNIQKGGKVKGTPLVVLPPAGGTAKIPFLFLVGGGKTGLNHAAQDLGFSGATATVPTSKGAPGIADGGRAEILLYIYAGSDAPSTMALARIPVTLALFAIAAE